MELNRVQIRTDIHHVGQFVQYLVDLLAVREADVGLPHQTPHFLPDVIFAQLNKRKHPQGTNVKISGGKHNVRKVMFMTNRPPYFHHQHVCDHIVQQGGQKSVFIVLQTLAVMVS